jgi:hypothetical protein
VLAINQLHVKDPSIVKRDLERNIKMINENYEKLGDSDGFNFIQEQTGIKKEKLMGRYKS